VLAEGAPAAEWLNNDAVFQVAWEYFNQLYPNDPRNASVEELKQNFSQAPGIQFYVAVENMAAEHGKDIIVSDPDDFTDAIVLKLSTLNYRIQLAKSLSGWGGLLLSAAFTYRNKKKALKEGKQDTEVTKTSMSRRSFLTKSLMALSATMLGSREVSRSEFLREDPIARKLVYDIEDYRDTIIAEGLDQLTASLEVGSRVAVIYGGFHMDAVKRYLASNARRKAVNTQYSLTYQKVASPMYRRFHFNQEKQGWETIERRPVFEK
jgi:hypothetical protein